MNENMENRVLEHAEIEAAERVPARFGAAIGAGPNGRHSTSQSEQMPPLRLRLPTEAEWEYACRAGTTGPFSCGDDIDPGQANFDGYSPYRGSRQGVHRKETVDVGSLPPNAWGLFEMHGNVWEWCQDWYGDYPSDCVSDPTGIESGGWRVQRGGGWFNVARNLRSACRERGGPGFRNRGAGFRLALGPELGQASEAGVGGTGLSAQGASGQVPGGGHRLKPAQILEPLCGSGALRIHRIARGCIRRRFG